LLALHFIVIKVQAQSTEHTSVVLSWLFPVQVTPDFAVSKLEEFSSRQSVVASRCDYRYCCYRFNQDSNKSKFDEPDETTPLGYAGPKT
jgi:hypothetical protein